MLAAFVLLSYNNYNSFLLLEPVSGTKFHSQVFFRWSSSNGNNCGIMSCCWGMVWIFRIWWIVLSLLLRAIRLSQSLLRWASFSSFTGNRNFFLAFSASVSYWLGYSIWSWASPVKARRRKKRWPKKKKSNPILSVKPLLFRNQEATSFPGDSRSNLHFCRAISGPVFQGEFGQFFARCSN